MRRIGRGAVLAVIVGCGGPIQSVNLGSEDGVAYPFSGATGDGAIASFAKAEASRGVLDDGLVVGVRIGAMNDEGVRITVEGADGDRSVVELVLDSTRQGQAWAVTGVDATETPTSACEIRLSGPWMGAPAS